MSPTQKPTQKRAQNILLILGVIVLALLPLWIVERPAAGPDGEVAIFGGADDQAKNLIGEINPEYQPWFESLIEPASGEIASMLFALQAAIGAGFIGYYIGVGRTREKMRREMEELREELRAAAEQNGKQDQ
ncbi:MAG: energy-coupling factor ABC transporter substrate-binding protein [Propionivibrio sp.]|uniref:energy-coupling factor ABC transporter substrate-binding protein n=1 Tax=Propionivibrio sp. TaxID=2212460 RepID=UPI001B565CF2|nr:energy-coupling factor ABC transporter substrate-binding protein [Propionivibrio sp.]MBP7202946.1 energy-coupling factor ABC transporter substrate-binding protein [Propionivibrio sp.]